MLEIFGRRMMVFWVTLLALLIQLSTQTPVAESGTSPTAPATEVPILHPQPDDTQDDDDDDAIVIGTESTEDDEHDDEPDHFNPADCVLPKSKGPCRAIIDSWYFSTTTKNCQPFVWSGCGGNANRFSDKSFCEQHCSVERITDALGKDSLGSTKCPPVVRKCECDFVENPESGCMECPCQEKLPIGSVSGNPDELEPKAEKPEEVCQLPETRGNCRAMMTRWRYDASSKKCIQFHFGGCDGNANNFVSEEKCNAFCRGQ